VSVGHVIRDGHTRASDGHTHMRDRHACASDGHTRVGFEHTRGVLPGTRSAMAFHLSFTSSFDVFNSAVRGATVVSAELTNFL